MEDVKDKVRPLRLRRRIHSDMDLAASCRSQPQSERRPQLFYIKNLSLKSQW